MDSKPAPFVPPAPSPRTSPPSLLEMMRIVYRNPLELWGEPSYNEPWISVRGVGGPLVIANDPALIRHVLVDNAKNYKLATVRQMILRPILRDGLLTAEGEVWKRSPQSDGAGVHAAPHFRLCRDDAGAHRGVCRELWGGRRGRCRARHDHAHLRHLGRDAVFRRDCRRPDQFRQGDRPSVRDDGPGRPARPAAGARLAAAFHPAARAQHHGLLPPHRHRYGGNARSPARRRSGRGAQRLPDAAAQSGGAGRADSARKSRTTSSPSSAPATRPPPGRSAGPSICWPRRRGSASGSRRRSTRWWPGEPDPAELARKDAVHPRRLRGGAAALSAGAFDQPRADRADDRFQRPRICPRARQVLVMPWTVHRHRKLWDRPDAFLPERFHPGNARRSTATSICRSGPAPASASARVSPCRRRSSCSPSCCPGSGSRRRRRRRPWPVQKLTTQPQGGLPMRVVTR